MSKNPADYQKRVRQFLSRQYFMHHIGFNLEVIDKGRTEGTLMLKSIHLQQTGLVHGGVIATLADITSGFAAYTMVPPDHHVVTGELKVSFLYPGKGDSLLAVGWVLKAGKKLQFCESEIWAISGNNKKRIAKASATMVTVFPEVIHKE